jgi:enediyne biosynthesis protein E3
VLRKIRKLVLTPSMANASLVKRGFFAKNSDSVVLLETIGRSFLTGYGYAVGSRDTGAAESLLETVPQRFRGFAYEGAAMGYGVLVGTGLGDRKSLATFLTGPGERHIYMAYVGIGWACARLPTWRWSRILPTDPLLCWLVLDGYGFHQAYFHTRRYVDGRHQDRDLYWPFPHSRTYAGRAFDQGVGRALWFVEGTDVNRVAGRIESFPQHRRTDLWSGAALAATYAGGVDEGELRRFWGLAGGYRPHVAQASAFAAEARVRAGLVTEHTELATRVFCDMSPQEAAQICIQLRHGPSEQLSVPAYEAWRDRIVQRFLLLGRC